MVVVQPEERNMYDQHWQSSVLREKYPFINLVSPVSLSPSQLLLYMLYKNGVLP